VVEWHSNFVDFDLLFIQIEGGIQLLHLVYHIWPQTMMYTTVSLFQLVPLSSAIPGMSFYNLNCIRSFLLFLGQYSTTQIYIQILIVLIQNVS